MIKSVSYSPEHLLALIPRDCYHTELAPGAPLPPQPLHTFLIDQTPVAIFGGAFVHSKYFQAWAFLSDEVLKAPVEFTRKTRRLTDIYMSRYELERLEINVRSDYPIGQRFALAMGFELEGVMRRYSADGSDYNLYSRIK